MSWRLANYTHKSYGREPAPTRYGSGILLSRCIGIVAIRYGTVRKSTCFAKTRCSTQYSDSPCSPILYAPREQSAYCAPPRTLVLRTVEFLDESCCVSYPPHLQLCKRCNICATYKYNSGICIYCLWMKIKCNSLCNNGLYFAQMRSSYRETYSTCFYLRRDFYPMIVEDLRKPYSARS